MLQNQQNQMKSHSWKKIQDSNDHIFTLLHFEIIIDAVKSNEDEDAEPLYLGYKLMN